MYSKLPKLVKIKNELYTKVGGGGGGGGGRGMLPLNS